MSTNYSLTQIAEMHIIFKVCPVSAPGPAVLFKVCHHRAIGGYGERVFIWFPEASRNSFAWWVAVIVFVVVNVYAGAVAVMRDAAESGGSPTVCTHIFNRKLFGTFVNVGKNLHHVLSEIYVYCKWELVWIFIAVWKDVLWRKLSYWLLFT